MFHFTLLMLIPAAIAIGVTVYLYSQKKFMPWEIAVMLLAPAIVIGLGLGIVYWQGTTDTEVWNGQIVEREHHHVSCSHSYKCNCTTTTDKDGTTHESCDTCYEHPFDVDWTIHSSSGESLNIDRVWGDPQGLIMPPRWAAAYVGEPYSSHHTFTNYIKANPESVLLGTKGDMALWGKLIPKYPDKVYDYYHHDPMINMGVPNVDSTTWNWLIRDVNKQLGPSKQVNVILILVPTSDRSYMYTLKDAWLGGKKNDVDIVIGSEDGHSIGFTDVMTWSTNKAFAVDLRNRIQDIGTLDRRDDIQKAILTTVQTEFVRMHMHSMKWLMRSFQPSTTTMIWLFILAIGVEIGTAWWCIISTSSLNGR